MTLCATVKFVTTNEADIDDSKWHRSYAALRRSVWLHCGLLGKQAMFLSLMICAMMCEATLGGEGSQRAQNMWVPSGDAAF